MHFFLLLVWIAIAILLRFTHLTTKPVWADEFSTLVFSLGNSYRTIPINQPISLEALLQPLQPNPQTNIGSVVHHLLTESNHPPLFFVLTHLWLKLFASENGLVSLWAARAFSAMCGVISVPAVFSLGWLAFRSRFVGQVTAALMAVSPFGIYLAQEARHYTLAILWILASLSCLVVAANRLASGQKIPLWLCLVWVLVNALGIATHYFVMLTLLTEVIAIVGFLIIQHRETANSFSVQQVFQEIWHHPNTGRLAAVAIGTLASALVWLPLLQSIRGSELTRWLERGELDQSTWIDQILRLLAGLTTMLYILPIQDVPTSIVIASGVVLLLLLVGTVRWLLRGFFRLVKQSELKAATQMLSLFVASAIGLTLILTFGLGMNFASVFRYQFFYFPAVIVVLGAAISDYGRRTVTIPGINTLKVKGTVLISGILLMSLLGGVTVVSGLAYQKTHRPDRVASAVHRSFEAPALIAIPHKTHGQTGRLMGVAWELRRLNPEQANRTTFLLAHYDQEVEAAIAVLDHTLKQLPRPLDVWSINFRHAADSLSQTVLTQQGCVAPTKATSTDGYRYQRYSCAASDRS